MEQTFKDFYAEPPGGRFGYFSASDGVRIRFAAWRNEPEDKGTIVLLHGRREYIEKYYETIGELLARGFSVLTMDWRGQGLSGRPLKNPHKHHLQSYGPMVEDIDILLAQAADLPQPFTLMAHSMGAHAAIRYLHDKGAKHPFAKAILLAPMIGVHFIELSKLLVSGIAKMMTRFGCARLYALGQADYGPLQKSPASQAFLTSDAVRFQAEQDFLESHPDRALGGVTWGWLDISLKSIEQITAPGYPEAVSLDTLVVQCGLDRVVDNRAMSDFTARLPHGKLVRITDARHEVYRERDEIRAEFWQAVDDFLGI